MQANHKLLLRNIKQLVQVSDSKQPYKRMQECQDMAIKEKYSVVVGMDGNIHKVGKAEEIEAQFK